MNATPAPAEIRPEERRRAVVASVIGNAFEWFDFAIYGMFAVIISHHFFPAENDVSSLMAGVAAFGVAFFFRPLGGIFWGLFADRKGRKAALSAIMVMMAFSTAAIGLLPTYASIGIAAPVLMVLARIVQGFSVGGEFAGATSMLIEFAPKHRKGFYGSWQMFSQALAFGIGSLVAWGLTASMSAEALHSWGWRLPFILGVLIGPVGFYIRQRVNESPEFAALAERAESAPRSPLVETLKNYPREMLSGLGLSIVGTVSAYVVVFYLPIFAVKQLGMPMGTAQLSTLIATIVILVFCPIAGHVSDKLGRKTVFFPAIVAYGLLAVPLFTNFIAAPSFGAMLLTQCLIGVTMGFIWGPTPAALAEVFPVRIRSTGVSLAYNLAVLVFGGLAPLVLTWLIAKTGSPMVPAYYLAFSAVIGIGGCLLLRKPQPEARQTLATA